MPAALIRLKDHTHRLVIEPPIRTVDTSDTDYDDWENTRRCSLALESLIERFPAQWVWFHRR
jgi:KDO2-lipid IV(A) lauroyltransferase